MWVKFKITDEHEQESLSRIYSEVHEYIGNLDCPSSLCVNEKLIPKVHSSIGVQIVNIVNNRKGRRSVTIPITRALHHYVLWWDENKYKFEEASKDKHRPKGEFSLDIPKEYLS